MASGRGSNFKAVLAGIKAGKIKRGQVVGLIVDRPDTGAEKLALENGLAVELVNYKSLGDRSMFNLGVIQAVERFQPDLILTLGFMRILAADLVERFYGRIINVHPSLLPAFPGINAQKQAWEYGVRVTGATVHFMDADVDTGPIILQAPVIVPEDIDAEGLAELILQEEHRIIVQAVDIFCRNAFQLDGRRVRLFKN